ncbi:MAG: iron-containing alcohol dehydrogenase [Bacteroidales bacterium]|nr:iron-containing alcohol dehydrogenase [Bacteroidales bacterium]
MNNFIAYNPTRLHFGKGVVNTMSKHIDQKHKKVLLMYGKGSVTKNGSYNDTIGQLKKLNLEITEFSGIKPNPLASDVDSAAKLGIENKIDIIVALGGGSVIDSAKITAICIKNKLAAWDVMKGKARFESAIPLIAVLTLAATGTEMNPVAVLQNQDTKEKIGFGHPAVFPQHSFLDPVYTQSVPANYTAYGIVDLIAHSMEAYFGKGDASLSDKFVYAILHEAMEFGPALMKDLNNYELRANIMWAATNALNGITGHGRITGDWGVHGIGHILSFLYDTPHGASLSIVYPAWLKKMKERMPERIEEFGKAVFGVNSPDKTIEALESLFKKLNSPINLQEQGIGKDKFDEILNLMNKNNANGFAHKLDDTDRKEILEFMYGK